MSRRVAVPAGGFRDIAVLRLSSLGDVVLTLPVVHALRRAYPEAKLHVWVKEEFADVFAFDPAVDHVRVLEKDARRLEDLVSMGAELETCDLLVDLHGSLRTRVLTARQRAPLLRVRGERMNRARWVHARWSRPPRPPHALERYARVLAPIGGVVEGAPRLALDPEAVRWAGDLVATKLAGRTGVGLAPAARHFTKRWPEEHWRALIERLKERGLVCVAFSLPREKGAMPALAQAVEAAGGLWCTERLARQAALLARLRAAVTGDTGLMHVAAACGVPVVAMFGSTSPVLGFAPAGEGHRVLCREEPCQPCTLHGREACPKGHFRCMREMKPAEVDAALAEVLGTWAGSTPPAARDFR